MMSKGSLNHREWSPCCFCLNSKFLIDRTIKEFTNETYLDEDANPGGFSEAKLRSLFSVAVAAYILGGMIGALLGGYVADKFGRRRGLLYVQVFAVQGALLMGLSKYAGSFAMLGRNSIALLKSQQTFQQTFQQSFQYYRVSHTTIKTLLKSLSKSLLRFQQSY